MAKVRGQQFYVRVGIAAFIALSSNFLAPSIWPLVWFLAVVATQILERSSADRLIPKDGQTIRRESAAMIVALNAFTSAVYVAISAYLWFHGPAGQMFAIMVICGAMLHICLHMSAVRDVLIAGAIAQSVYLFGLPIASEVISKDANLAPLIVMLISGVLSLGHLVVGARKAQQATQALRAANALAEQQQKLAEAASQSKSDFLATISHEIRTPLNAVTSAAHLLNGTALSESQKEYVSILLDGSEVLLGLINEVLDMSKIEAGKMVLETTDISLPGVIGKLSSLWTPKAAERGLSLQIGLAPDVPDMIRGDALRLTQILFNLVSNAVKFTAQGGVRIVVGVVDAPGRPLLRFEVIDTGPGMAPEVVSRLFQNFEQADAGTTRRFGGTGLGLAISRRLAELMNGRLTVESQPGVGSTFRLEIPLQVSADNDAAIEVVAEADVDDRVPLSILAAEDNPVNRRLLNLLLEPMGWSLTMAENGAEAVEAAAREAFDIILMDMQMPVMSGLEATHTIRAGAGPNAATPIVALTANAFDDQRAVWLDAGAAAFLTKPINPTLLIETIASLVQEPASGSERLAS
jgi:signal transduction histidine kinase/ActR/RegA family two-component response regulator